MLKANLTEVLENNSYATAFMWIRMLDVKERENEKCLRRNVLPQSGPRIQHK
jgi:hypothetical protein